MERVARALEFPQWFGGNWDALEDCLTDLSWSDAAGPRPADRGRGGDAGATSGGICVDILASAADWWAERRRPFFAVFVDGAGARCRRSAGTVPKAQVTPKLPVSVLVVVHTAGRDVLLLERAARPGFWQSVTGSLERATSRLREAARRELREETGHRSAAARLSGMEPRLHVRDLSAHGDTASRRERRTTPSTCSASSCRERVPVALAPDEHVASLWLPWRGRRAQCFSWSNRDAIRMLGHARADAWRSRRPADAAGGAGSAGGRGRIGRGDRRDDALEIVCRATHRRAAADLVWRDAHRLRAPAGVRSRACAEPGASKGAARSVVVEQSGEARFLFLSVSHRGDGRLHRAPAAGARVSAAQGQPEANDGAYRIEPQAGAARPCSTWAGTIEADFDAAADRRVADALRDRGPVPRHGERDRTSRSAAARKAQERPMTAAHACARRCAALGCGCATIVPPFDATGVRRRRCANAPSGVGTLDAAVARRAWRTADARIAEFPYVRVDRLLATLPRCPGRRSRAARLAERLLASTARRVATKSTTCPPARPPAVAPTTAAPGWSRRCIDQAADGCCAITILRPGRRRATAPARARARRLRRLEPHRRVVLRSRAFRSRTA